MQGEPQSGSRRRRKRLSERARREIGEQLKSIYDAAVNEPLPARFTRLLDELDAKQAEDEWPPKKNSTQD